MDTEKWIKMASAKNSFDLELKLSLLLANGIQVRSNSETINKLYAFSRIPIYSGAFEDPLGIYVHPSRYEQAVEILASTPETESAIKEKIVLLDRTHATLVRENVFPSAPVDDLVDMTEFSYLGEYECPDGIFRFFLTAKEWQAFPLTDEYSAIECAKAFKLIPYFDAAYFSRILDGWIPPSPIFEVFGFADTAKAATNLGALVVEGKKTGTSGLLWSYEDEKEPLPQPGAVSIVLDGSGEPLCAIQDDSVTILPFSGITREHAGFEGEGDGSLSYWKRVHTKFFSPYCKELGKALGPDTPIVFERFHVIKRFAE